MTDWLRQERRADNHPHGWAVMLFVMILAGAIMDTEWFDRERMVVADQSQHAQAAFPGAGGARPPGSARRRQGRLVRVAIGVDSSPAFATKAILRSSGPTTSLYAWLERQAPGAYTSSGTTISQDSNCALIRDLYASATSLGRRTWMAATRASMQCMSVSGSKCCDSAPTSTPCASHNRQAPADVGQKAVRDKAGCATMIGRVCGLVVDPECFPI